ncbi:MAG: hypothetical protein AB7F99_13570 [Vicinamibacterales bacterium]
MSTDNALWAVSTHFNPCHYQQRLRNHRVFRERLGVPLLTVELSCDGIFELDAGDADRLLRFRTRDVLWQKERLLNLAFAALPESCDGVAWLDGDVLFERDDWAADASRLLETSALIQLYSHFTDLPRDVTSPSVTNVMGIRTGESFVYQYAQGGNESALFDQMWGSGEDPAAGGSEVRRTRQSGLAWAARRDVLLRHGLYDACILGSGDRAIVCAAYGKHATSAQNFLRNEAQRRHYLEWAGGFAAAVGGRVSFVPGRVFHLWHGEFRDRRYRERWRDLAPFGFDPHVDIAVDESGCWRWNSDKPAMHEYVRQYFSMRQEDGAPQA